MKQIQKEQRELKEQPTQIYYFEQNKRRVIPFYNQIEVIAKGRWYGKTIQEIYQNEFPSVSQEELEKQIEEHTLKIINRKGEERETTLTTIINAHDKMISQRHLHEPPVPNK